MPAATMTVTPGLAPSVASPTTGVQRLSAGGLRWQVQLPGCLPTPAGGPRPWLLLHGTGASMHSWRRVVDALRPGDRAAAVADAPGTAPTSAPALIVPDLPGHGGSGMLPPTRRSMAGMAAALGELLQALSLQPAVVVGHSAGAALALRLALDGGLAADCQLIGLNAALRPFDGLAGLFYAPMARVLSRLPLVPTLAAWRARDAAAVRRLIAATGSQLDDAALGAYTRLLADPAHIAGVLAMMADWDLAGLWRDLPALRQPLTLLAGSADRAVPPAHAALAAHVRPGTAVQTLEGLGHLMHEEDPARLAATILGCMAAPPANLETPAAC